MNSAKIVAWVTLFLLPISAAVILIALINGSVEVPLSAATSGETYAAAPEIKTLAATAIITDLAISVSVFPPGQINPGQTIGYNIVITNTGTSVIGSATLTDLLSPYILDRRVYSSGTTINNSGIQPEFVWSIGSLSPGTAAFIDIVGMIDPTLSNDVTITNTVIISTSGDQENANNSAQSILLIDVPSIDFDSNSIQVDEADGSFTIDVVLSHSNLNGLITVDYTTGNSTIPPNATAQDFVPTSGTLTFDPGYRRKTLTIQLTDDDIDEAVESFALILRDPVGASIDTIGRLTVFIEDDDEAGVQISSSRAFLSETGTTDSYNIRLNSQPEADVQIHIITDEQTQSDVDSLLFTDANWALPQTVTILAVDDDVAEDEHTATIEHRVESNDPIYAQLTPISITAEIVDDDITGITFSTRVLTVTEGVSTGGSSAEYTLNLLGQPTSAVIIEPIANGQINTTPPQLTFDVENWDQPQSFHIEAVDDADIEGEHGVSIGHVVRSDDLAYNHSQIGNVNVKIFDNDSAGISLSKERLELTEGGQSSESELEYAIGLMSKPTEIVTVTISAYETLNIEPLSLVFSPSVWSTAQTVTVKAVNDRIAYGEQTLTLTHTVSSLDSDYLDLPPKTLVAVVEDDDTPEIVIAAAGTVQVSESGTSGTYSIFVKSQPAEPLHIAFITDSQIRVEPASITIDDLNWRTSLIVTVFANDDDLSEGIHSSSIRHSVSSDDPAYNGYVIDSVSVMISDNDSPETYAVAGMTFQDANKNGQVDDGEESISDVSITIIDTATKGQNYSRSTTSDAQGNYQLKAVPAGQYTLLFSPPVGYRSNLAEEISIVIDGEDLLVPPFPITRQTGIIYLPLTHRQ